MYAIRSYYEKVRVDMAILEDLVGLAERLPDFAETGEEAVGLTGTKEYTCVFLDVVLPGIDGYQVCKLIKSNKQAVKRTAVVMLG